MTTSTFTRGALVAASAFLALGAVSGCAAGLHAVTNSEIGATAGINATVGTVVVRDALIGSADSGATVEATFINTGADPDTLMSVSSPVAGSVALLNGKSPVASLTLPPTVDGIQAPLVVGGSGPVISLVDVRTAPGVGTLVPVTFTFAKAGALTLSLPVVASG